MPTRWLCCTFLHAVGLSIADVDTDEFLKEVTDFAQTRPLFTLAFGRPAVARVAVEVSGWPGSPFTRVVVCSEVKPGGRFDEARVKLLIGGDRIKARRMRQDFFSFRPTHKLWLLGNHRPGVGTAGFAFWRRMRLIPFGRVVPGDRRIDNLAEVLVTEEGPGVLSWLIAGAQRYLSGQKDLSGPERVRIATAACAGTEDHTGRFVGESCTLRPGLRVGQAHLCAVYRAWCQQEGAPAVSARAFAARVRERAGLVSPKGMILSNQRKYYPGIGLVADEETV